MPTIRQLLMLLVGIALLFPSAALAKHGGGAQPPSYGTPSYAGPKVQHQQPYGPPSYAGPKYKNGKAHPGGMPPGQAKKRHYGPYHDYGRPHQGAFVPPGQAKKHYRKPKHHSPPAYAPAWGERRPAY